MKNTDYIKKIRKLFQDNIILHCFFDNQFHIEWFDEEYWVSKNKSNREIIKEMKNKFNMRNNSSINSIYRNEKKIKDFLI